MSEHITRSLSHLEIITTYGLAGTAWLLYIDVNDSHASVMQYGLV